MNTAAIKRNNEQLGFETMFFNESKGIISYTERGVIYLNTAYEKVGMANKREILHHFEKHPYFQAIKSACLAKLERQEYKKLYKFYLKKYETLYSKEEIKNGVLDNEMVIDMIIGNGKFKVSLQNYAKKFYKDIISCLQKWADGKRYTSYTVETEKEIEM